MHCRFAVDLLLFAGASANSEIFESIPPHNPKATVCTDTCLGRQDALRKVERALEKLAPEGEAVGAEVSLKNNLHALTNRLDSARLAILARAIDKIRTVIDERTNLANQMQRLAKKSP